MPARCPVLLVNDTRVDRHHGCTAVMRQLDKLLDAQGFDVIARWPAHADWRGNPEFETALSCARLVVVNGEGTIHHNRPAGRRLLEVGGAARALGVPAALINTGWEANNPELTALLADFALVAARDETSAAAMRAVAREVMVVPDLSLCSDPPPYAERRQGIGFTDNVERLRALELARLCHRAEGTWISLHHRRDWLSFMRSGLSLKADLPRPIRLARLLAMRHKIWLSSQDDIGKFLCELAGLELLVSGRFHACTLALVTGTPFVAQPSNTGKISALIADAGLDPQRAALPADLGAFAELTLRGWSAAENEARMAYLGEAKSRAASLATALGHLGR